jgi:hypothetical protein
MKKITDAEYRREWDRLYVESMKAGSAEECDSIQKSLDHLNARKQYTAALEVGFMETVRGILS